MLLGGLGWKLGGYRVSILFAGSIVLLAAAIYTYADRIVMGMLGARELVQGEAPALHSTVERLALRGRDRQAAALRAARQLSARAVGGRGAGGGSGIAISVGLMGVASPAELEGIVAHEVAHIRHRDVLLQTVVGDRRDVRRRARRGSAVRCSARSSSCSRRSPRRSCT